jgi:hypothetical protein
MGYIARQRDAAVQEAQDNRKRLLEDLERLRAQTLREAMGCAYPQEDAGGRWLGVDAQQENMARLLNVAKNLRLAEQTAEMYQMQSRLGRTGLNAGSVAWVNSPMVEDPRTTTLETAAGCCLGSADKVSELIKALREATEFDNELHTSGVIECGGNRIHWWLEPDWSDQLHTDHRCEVVLNLESEEDRCLRQKISEERAALDGVARACGPDQVPLEDGGPF